MKANLFKKRFSVLLLVFSIQLTVFPFDSYCQYEGRTEIKIPDIPGYITMKCDFHMHTVCSDGRVWPTLRANEAWNEGLDAFAITDHIEYTPNENDIPINFNRSYEIAKPAADNLYLILIRGGEISRDMPPGHLNAIFLKDVTPLDTPKFKDAVKAAINQGAFVFWNHPGYIGHQPDGKSRWYPVHTELYEYGWMHGIEVVNQKDYYPRAHRWCLEKKLTMMGSSDVHDPASWEYDFHKGEHRPMTLVFVKEKTIEAIKEALFERRTAVWSKNILIGEEKYLKPIFDESIEIINPDVTVKGKGSATIQIRNKSDISFELALDAGAIDISAPGNITLNADKIVLLEIKGTSEVLSGTKKICIPYKVKNLLITPEEGLHTEIIVNVTFISVPPETEKVNN